MKTNFLLVLTTTALIFSVFLTFQPGLKSNVNIGKYKKAVEDNAPSKQQLENRLDEKGCSLTAEYEWCESLNKCLLKNEECPTVVKKTTYTHIECTNEGGTVRNTGKCLREEEKLGNIDNQEESICCVPIRGRI